MQKFLKTFFKGDPVIWSLVVIAMAFSAALVFSATSNTAFRAEHATGDFYAPIMSHVKHIFMALGVCLLGSRVPPKYYERYCVLALMIAFLLLIYVGISGAELNGGKRWLTLMGLQFQPSEFARLALINYTAHLLGAPGYAKASTFWRVFAPAALICLMIFVENVSTAALIAVVIFFMAFIGGANRKRLLIVFVAGLVTLFIAVTALMLLPDSTAYKLGGRLPTAKARIERFFKGKESSNNNPSKSAVENVIASLDIDGKDSQTAYSQIAIANGGISGVGAGKSETRYILPHPYSDFIYSMIAEEYGVLGCLCVIFAYAVLFFRIGAIANKTQNMYPKLLLMGIGFAITIQAIVNMMVATAIIPVTGQPLPFLSRGGTSYLITSTYFAIMLSVTHHIRKNQQKAEAQLLSPDAATQVDLTPLPTVAPSSTHEPTLHNSNPTPEPNEEEQ